MHVPEWRPSPGTPWGRSATKEIPYASVGSTGSAVFFCTLLTSIGFGAGFIRSRSFSISNATNDLARLAKSFASALGALPVISLCSPTASWYGFEYLTVGIYGGQGGDVKSVTIMDCLGCRAVHEALPATQPMAQTEMMTVMEGAAAVQLARLERERLVNLKWESWGRDIGLQTAEIRARAIHSDWAWDDYAI